MRRALPLAAILALVAAPVTATAPDIFRTPYIPTNLGDPRDGTVVLTLNVWNGTEWATDTTVVNPAVVVLPVECSSLPKVTG